MKTSYVRRQASLERVMGTYRRVFITVSLLVGLMAVFSALEFAFGVERTVELFAARAGAATTMLLLLRWGHVRLKQELRAAASEQQRLLDQAYQDALTGAFTRSHFLDHLRQILRSGDGRPMAYMQIDMDNLKVLNDSHGHGAGDTALVHLVKTLKTLLPDAVIGRLGGDEFGICIAGHDNRAALVRIGGQILAKLGQPIAIEGRPIRLSATIGVALWPQDAAEADELVSKADLALYKGKKDGRATIVAFESELLADERHKRFVERDLRAAIMLGELELHYQPVFAADGTTLVSREALVRWQHPVRGLMLPGEFIGIAEQSDLIDKLGEWVVRRACTDFERLETPRIAINVSVVQLRRAEFASRLAAIVVEHRVPFNAVVLEVTESLPLASGSVEQRNLEALRQLGIRVAIDDFGAGFASLEYLRRFPFDIIKIDRSYVAGLPESQIDGLIVSAIAEIARSLGVEVIAEGIETPEQLQFLQGAGCTALQGYLLGRPVPLVAMSESLAAAA